MGVSINTKYVEDFISKIHFMSLKKKLSSCHDMLHNKTGEGADFTGWLDLPINYDKEEFERIKKAADKISSRKDKTSSRYSYCYWNRRFLFRI